MCGIFAYTGKKNAAEVLLNGLKSLEYRGYDSTGIYIPVSGSFKAVGAVHALEKIIPKRINGTSGIAHLRWATHGEPTKINAHPHHDCKKDIWVVHNGIIENFQELKANLIKKGHSFSSETDTEVLVHLVEDYLQKEKDFEKAVSRALQEVVGTFGAVFSYKHQPQTIIGARMGAPVVIGLGEKENFIASDASPILKYTKKVVYLHDGDVVTLTPTTHKIYSLNQKEINRKPEIVSWDVDLIQKNGFEHFMLKEIMEGPQVIENTLRGRLLPDLGLVKLGGLESVAEKLRTIKRIIIVGCGTAYYAGLVGEYMLEEHAGIAVEVEVGSEFRYRKPVMDKDTVLLAISQSGETADTLEAIREAKRKGIVTLGIVNTVGSTISRETDAGIFNHAGPEIGVASTKGFISQVTALALLSVFLGRQRSMSQVVAQDIVRELLSLPEKIKDILSQHSYVKTISKKYSQYKNFLYIARKYNYPIALEGALKLKEVSYIHAEGYGAGEMKHGPLAMIDPYFPTIAIALTDSVYEKMVSNIQEIKARKGKVLAIINNRNDKVNLLADDVLVIPKTIEMLSPILACIPLQLFAYYSATLKNFNVDQPRNLAKSVTVE